MKSNTDTLLYDLELGSIIRGIYIQRVKDADDHIAYIKSLEN